RVVGDRGEVARAVVDLQQLPARAAAAVADELPSHAVRSADADDRSRTARSVEAVPDEGKCAAAVVADARHLAWIDRREAVGERGVARARSRRLDRAQRRLCGGTVRDAVGGDRLAVEVAPAAVAVSRELRPVSGCGGIDVRLADLGEAAR